MLWTVRGKLIETERNRTIVKILAPRPKRGGNLEALRCLSEAGGGGRWVNGGGRWYGGGRWCGGVVWW